MRAVPLIALASVKSSPGVTTAALALASGGAGTRRLLVEADPSGGDLGLWLGLPAAAGLAGLAAAARHRHDTGLAWRHARELAGGAPDHRPGRSGAGRRVRGRADHGEPPAGTGAPRSRCWPTAGGFTRGPRPWRWPPPRRSRCWWPGPASVSWRTWSRGSASWNRPGCGSPSCWWTVDGGLPASRPTRSARSPAPRRPRAGDLAGRSAGGGAAVPPHRRPGPGRRLPLLREAAAAAAALQAALGHPAAAPGLAAGPHDHHEREVSASDRG